MMNSKPFSPMRKGQLRCFKCREGFMMKEGAWQPHGNQEVFLCNACERAARPASDKESGRVK